MRDVSTTWATAQLRQHLTLSPTDILVPCGTDEVGTATVGAVGVVMVYVPVEIEEWSVPHAIALITVLAVMLMAGEGEEFTVMLLESHEVDDAHPGFEPPMR